MRFVRTFAAKALLGVVSLFGDRTIRLASLAGLVLCGMVALFAAHLLRADGIPTLEGSGEALAEPGGETVIAKLDPAGLDETTLDPAKPVQTKPVQAETSPPVQPVFAPGHLAMMLAPTVPEPPDEEPNLSGLNEIPPELIWNRPPGSEKKATPKAFAAFSSAREELPWDAVEPVPFAPLASDTAAVTAPADGTTPAVAARPPLNLPDSNEVRTWLKSKVTEIKGADRSRPLYHFELWLEPPAALKQRLVGVVYEFSTPAIRPRSQASSDKTSGFRISAGGLACADEITVTLRFDDGSVQKVVLDGCKLLS